jgi:hypothetical protein
MQNKTSEIIHLDLAYQIIQTITSTFSSIISSLPMEFSCAWNQFTLPSISLDNPHHLDHMVNKLRNKALKLPVIEMILRMGISKLSKQK